MKTKRFTPAQLFVRQLPEPVPPLPAMDRPHINKLILALLTLSLLGSAQARASEASKPTVFKVDLDGVVWLNGLKISRKMGTDAPAEIISAEKSKPITRYESDRAAWHSFKKIGVILSRRNDPKSDGFAIILPANDSPEFPGVIFEGVIVLDRVRIESAAFKKLTRNDILSLLKSGPRTSLMDDQTVSITYGRTTVYIEFDEQGLFQNLTISVPSTRP